ncbi:MAG TPA: DUF424 domain-containing protein [Candidatus Nanoarchaeia archaeon]|nr:DUF424 domain-containing protein [Candidatus Nanoarchaeia archaeon]
MIIKIHRAHEGRKLVALCDNELIGKVFEEGDAFLDLRLKFYAGEEKGRDEVLEALKNASIVNAVGKESVGLLVSAKIVEEKCILKVNGIPHAQAVI